MGNRALTLIAAIANGLEGVGHYAWHPFNKGNHLTFIRKGGDSMRPIQRSKLRLWAGTIYYRTKRYGEWYLRSSRLARTVSSQLLPYSITSHATPLYRRLRDVDMSLQHNKVKNLKLALQPLNGVVIQPGETFSYWRLIGKPTKRKGYVEGMVLFYGSFREGIGGGLCQLSNLIYWLTLHTPLKVTERHRHSYDVFPDANRTQPFGSGATCAYNYLDLQIYNPTNEPYQLELKLTEDMLVGKWRSTVRHPLRYEVYEREHRMTQQHWGGYIRSNDIYRKTWNGDGELLNDEWIASNEALMMYEPLLKASNSEEVESCV